MLTEYLDAYAAGYKPYKGGAFCYEDGCLYRGLIVLAEATGDPRWRAHLERLVGAQVAADGTLAGYELDEFNIDNLLSGRALTWLARETGDPRWRLGADRLAEQLARHPRTRSGVYWHKQRYPWQVWLDGLYMGLPFQIEYAQLADRPDLTADALEQLRTALALTWQPATGLYVHGYDESRAQAWADPVTGQSPAHWARALGWLAMTLADVADLIGPDAFATAGLAEPTKALAERLETLATPRRALAAGHRHAGAAGKLRGKLGERDVRLCAAPARSARARRRRCAGIAGAHPPCGACRRTGTNDRDSGPPLYLPRRRPWRLRWPRPRRHARLLHLRSCGRRRREGRRPAIHGGGRGLHPHCNATQSSGEGKPTMSDLFSLAGKRALVTGATTGIGQAIAVALASAGAGVICAGRSPAAKTLALIEAAGGKGEALALDFADPLAGGRAFEAVGPVDILINNAGLIRRADAVSFSEADWDAVIDVNLKAVFFTSQGFARAAFARGAAGAIINIASLLSFQGGIRVPSYTASKHGVAGLTRLLACEWAGRGINVNAIAPGYIATSNTEALRADPERSRAILDRIPAGRWGEAEDIGGTAIFLASPAAKYIHGAIINVDGGWLAR